MFTFPPSIVGAIFVFIAILILCFYVIRATMNLNNDIQQDTHIINKNVANTAMNLVFDRNGTIDCNNTHIPCVTDRQCRDNCALQTAVGNLACVNGFCSSISDTLTGHDNETVNCDIKRGMIKVFVASEFVVDQICISTYREIVDDLGETRPYICDKGSLNIDLSTRQFSPDDCTCDVGYTKLLFTQTALARAVPVCIPNSQANVYSRVYE